MESIRKMKKIRSFTLAAVVFGAIEVFAALPMEVFDSFRRAAIENDPIAMLEVTGGLLQDNVKKNDKIPRDLRSKLINCTDVFEDVYIRMNDQNKAVIYAHYVLENKPGVICFTLSGSGGENFVVVSGEEKTPPGAKVYAERFFNALDAGRENELQEYFSDELFSAYKSGKMPGLTIPGSSVITSVKNNGDEVVVSVTRLGLKGDVTMEKSGIFWKVTKVDNILSGVHPRNLVRKFCAYSNIYRRHLDAFEDKKFARYIASLNLTGSASDGGAEAAEYLQAELSDAWNITPVAGKKESDTESVVYFKAESKQSRELLFYEVKVKKNGEKWEADTECNDGKASKMIDLSSIGDDFEPAVKEELDKEQELISAVFAAKVSGIAGKDIGNSDKSVFLYAGSVYTITSTVMSGARIVVKAKLRGNSFGELSFEFTKDENGKFVITAVDAGNCYKAEDSPVYVVKKFQNNVFARARKAEDESTAALVDETFIEDLFGRIKELGEFNVYRAGFFKENSNDLSSATVESKFILSNADGSEGSEVTVTYTLTFSDGKWIISDMDLSAKKFKKNAEAPSAEGNAGDGASKEADTGEDSEEDSEDEEDDEE